MAQRVAIEKYIDFRFRSFVVITPEDEAKYYRETLRTRISPPQSGTFNADARRKTRGDQRFLTEQKVIAEIERFLDFAKRRSEIICIERSLKIEKAEKLIQLFRFLL